MKANNYYYLDVKYFKVKDENYLDNLMRENIRSIIEDRKLKQIDLADKLGMKPQQLNRYLKKDGQTIYHIAKSLADAMEVPVEVFVCPEIIDDSVRKILKLLTYVTEDDKTSLVNIVTAIAKQNPLFRGQNTQGEDGRTRNKWGARSTSEPLSVSAEGSTKIGNDDSEVDDSPPPRKGTGVRR